MTRKSISNALVLAGAIAVAGSLVATTAQAACEDDWKECAGKPWVDGDTMDTPMGSIWWPHAIWGEGDQAGSTNWYTKPEVVMRALRYLLSERRQDLQARPRVPLRHADVR